ncbi:DUF4097 family beta strand repeat protein [Streptomyces sp. AV19]|uniref:DUF4097 family beta strand repeat-containing protein n=1 Tax=Streptomyces sp. AV19 TaxID=2793068 RepID=UPI0018FE1E00|nr:DUF4097 family beta strand repeat-containing protein [Streptomyces sp. AV19]MBH1938084.1 DUF4097 family beta strand repeat protein [Streptomyces sp. AV19]MDG4533578.1 DUF4097 family beta strand repeat-containing protein [Streptomyces sp. AV19]
MPTPPQWKLAAPQKLTFEGPVKALNVRLVSGTVSIVGTADESARMELTEISGPPLLVALEEGMLNVGYEDLPWNAFRRWFDHGGWRRSAAVTLAVPAGTRVEVGVVDAGAVVSGISGDTDVRGVSGDATLVGLTGNVRVHTVSGSLEAQSLAGELRFHTVSGGLTLVEGRNGTVKAESVNGDMAIDLAGAGLVPSLGLTTVSGGIAVRLPHPVHADVEVSAAAGGVSCAFESLAVTGQWGAKRVAGRLGDGRGGLKVTTVSGAVALLRSTSVPEGRVDAPAWGKGI